MRLRSAGGALLGAAALAVTACGSDDKKGSSSPEGAAGQPFQPPAISTDLTKKPTVPTTAGLPPEKLVVRDVVAGKGDAAKAGDKLQVKYVGVAYSTDTEFDTNWGPGGKLRDKLFQTRLTAGPGGVIKGWVQGLPGMREAGRRLLVVPPDLGYGVQGSPPTIAPSETLIFVVDLKKVG